jgi:hypothetical protein
MHLEELAKFLVKAKRNAWAGNGKEIKPQRPGFKELEFREGDWYYRDSYAGFFWAPGQEVVWYQNTPVWAMAYNGGMIGNNLDLAVQTFAFLKEALKRVNVKMPFRGPAAYSQEDYEYYANVVGDIRNFKGHEDVFHRGCLEFEQDYIGGLIVPKSAK